MSTLYILFITLLVLDIIAFDGELIVLTELTARNGNDAKIGRAFIKAVTDAT